VTGAVSASRAAWLLTRLRLRRQLNQMESIWRFRTGSSGRTGTGRASSGLMILGGLVALSMLGSFTSLAYQSIANMQAELGSVVVPGDAPAGGDTERSGDAPGAPPSLQPIAAEPGGVIPRGVAQGATLAVMLLLAAALLIAVGNREITRPEWDLEWLVTLPLPLSTLVLSKLVERVITNHTAFLILAPFLSVLAWTCGYRWMAPVLGLAFTLVLLVLVGTAQILIDTGLRLALPPPQLRNLQAAMSIVSMFPLLLVMSMALPARSFVFAWAGALPDAAAWFPTGLAVRALAAADARSLALLFAMMTGQVALLSAAGVALVRWQLRHGVVAAGMREAVARRPQPPRPAGMGEPLAAWTPLSAVQRRELRLLGRDRNFLAQTLLLPAVIVGMQIFLNVRSNIFVGAMEHPANLAAIAFLLLAYTLAFSAFQTLNAEGQALWILYCVPHSLESILRQKTQLWAAVAAVYPVTIFAIAIALAGGISLPFIGCAAIVLAGVPIFAVIATALGVFGCDPLAQEVQRRLRVTYLYLYMMLASLYAYAIYASDVWQRIALMILTMLVAIALWQKARDRFDYLLDPSAAPPPQVSVSDGLIAALLFFVLQAIVALALMGRAKILTANQMWVAFCLAGAATYIVMRLVYWRVRPAGVPRMLDGPVGPALLWGAAGGVAASLAGLAYIEVVAALDLFPAAQRAGVKTTAALPWLAAVAIVAAPVFEEFIFRGLIFRGLERSFGVTLAAVASAGIFAIVHPPVAVIPVFAMGLVAAAVYHRARMLIAPIVVHALYNAAVIGFQWNAMKWLQ